MLRRPGRDEALQQPADLGDLNRFLERDDPDPGTPVPLDVHQTLTGEHRDRGAHRKPAAAEPLAQIHFDQTLAGRELAGQDGGPQLVEHAWITGHG